ncbi:MAG TPA: adenylate/guanylate cyclase domain-containing protein [Gaiellaceae bacterium]|nr:adenylate/guanylate cyclase domain-containing protein [Gaiellaceae bacterium]
MRRTAWTLALLALPLAGFFLLLGFPRLDVIWEQQPAHFWLVLISAVLSAALGLLMGETAARRGDARVLLASLAFLVSAGFLALHALATPGVLLAGKNAGFQIASAVGLLLGSGFAAASAVPLKPGQAEAVVRNRPVLLASVATSLGVWAALALGTLPPLDEAITPEAARDPLLGLWVAGLVLYGYAAYRYGRLYARRRASVALAAVAAWTLLAQAMLAVALSRNWHASWWEWHLLMLLAYALFARAVWREWKREGSSAEVFADLYEDRTLGRREELSVLFADLQGFTAFSEATPADEVHAMLDEQFAAAAPAVEAEGGEVVQTVGDAIFAVFRGGGHERRAARAGLALQEETGRVAARHPGWPRFRVGVNSGEAHVGVVQAPGARSYGPTGDVVNTGARLEGQARAGEVVIAERTRRALGASASVEDLGELPVKGKERGVRAFVLRALAPDGDERDDGLDHEHAEGER